MPKTRSQLAKHTARAAPYSPIVAIHELLARGNSNTQISNFKFVEVSSATELIRPFLDAVAISQSGCSPACEPLCIHHVLLTSAVALFVGAVQPFLQEDGVDVPEPTAPACPALFPVSVAFAAMGRACLLNMQFRIATQATCSTHVSRDEAVILLALMRFYGALGRMLPRGVAVADGARNGFPEGEFERGFGLLEEAGLKVAPEVWFAALQTLEFGPLGLWSGVKSPDEEKKRDDRRERKWRRQVMLAEEQLRRLLSKGEKYGKDSSSEEGDESGGKEMEEEEREEEKEEGEKEEREREREKKKVEEERKAREKMIKWNTKWPRPHRR